MAKIEIKKGIYWVGAVDWNVRNFHGHTYTTKRGTTYNAYLIPDEQVTLVDTVHASFCSEIIDRITQIVPISSIKNIVVNHVETDHSGALPELMRLCPNAKLFGTAKCKEGLYKNYYGNWDFQIVKTGDKIKIGKKTLAFVEAPMIHWPDSMFTYAVEDKVLLPNDAFGQHFATAERFDDEVDQCALMDEAAKYYANILMPLGPLILRKLEEVQKMNIPIDIIAPSHGIIWRKDPMKIINAYLSWSKNETKRKVVIVYETMWGATEKMARLITQGVADSGVHVKLFNIAESDITEVIKEMLDSKGYIVGSSTHDNNMLTTIAGFMHFLEGLKPKNRIGAAFGSYGWAGGAVDSIENILKKTGVEIIQPSLSVKYMPDEAEKKKSYQFGADFAKRIQ